MYTLEHYRYSLHNIRIFVHRSYLKWISYDCTFWYLLYKEDMLHKEVNYMKGGIPYKNNILMFKSFPCQVYIPQKMNQLQNLLCQMWHAIENFRHLNNFLHQNTMKMHKICKFGLAEYVCRLSFSFTINERNLNTNYLIPIY